MANNMIKNKMVNAVGNCLRVWVFGSAHKMLLDKAGSGSAEYRVDRFLRHAAGVQTHWLWRIVWREIWPDIEHPVDCFTKKP
ncbi:hypothetical protein H2136_21890 [Aeromonas hydrophila]|uniref:Uncharacterized protein n=1 Tax=Aeromonas hydrophila TaxID=644 RepID=A0A926FKK8_AERHY|nr:hypothetical protein [Aeromonas hydrophila]